MEHDAGRGAGFSDEDYEKAGGRIVYSSHEAYGRADIVFKVGPVEFEETEWLHEGAIIMGFLHLAAGRREAVDSLLARKITAIAYETIQQDDGALPVLIPLSQIAGAMAPQIAARLLQNDHGGTGILLGGVARGAARRSGRRRRGIGRRRRRAGVSRASGRASTCWIATLPGCSTSTRRGGSDGAP